MDKSSKSNYFTSISQFKFLQRKRLGKGSFGEVKLALHLQTSKLYAIKIIQPKQITTQVGMKALERQTTVHSSVDHPHIIRLWQVFREDSKIYMVMEYAEKGNLFYYQNQKRVFSQQQASVFFAQTLSAVEYLHSLNFVHRDLKPENLLLDRDLNIKICDLGWVVEGINQKHTTFCGTYQYMAPQMIFDRQYDYRIDIWALGVLLYELLHGFAPFEGEKAQQVRESMMEGEIHIDPDLSYNAQNLIFNILKVDPDQRLTIQNIKSHPWMIDMKKRNLLNLTQFIVDQNQKILQNLMKKQRKQSRKINQSSKNVHQRKQQMFKGFSNKTLLMLKQNKKSRSPQLKINLSTQQLNIAKPSKQRMKQKQRLFKIIRQGSNKKLTAGHRSQNSDCSDIIKNPRLKTQLTDNKTIKYEIVRFNTEAGEGYQPIEQRSTMKKKKMMPKKNCLYATNLIKTSQKPKLIRKSID